MQSAGQRRLAPRGVRAALGQRKLAGVRQAGRSDLRFARLGRMRDLVAKARGELAAAGDAEATADSLDAHDLEWYDPSELAVLCEELS